MNNRILIPKTSWDGLIDGLVAIKLGREHILDSDDLSFLSQLKYLNENLVLTELGTEVTRLEYVTQDKQAAAELHKFALLNSPVTQAVLQSLWGVACITPDQIKNALIYLGVSEPVVSSRTTNLLNLLNKFGIITYAKKIKSVKLLEAPIDGTDDTTPEHVYIDRSRPYANDYYIRHIIREASGTLMWLDKYFQKDAFEWLFREADASKISDVQIVSCVDGDPIDPYMLADFKRLRKELQTRGITLEWRTLARSESHDFHDRWLLDNNGLCYNIPSINSIKSGQRSEMHKSPHFDTIAGVFRDYFSAGSLVS